MVAKPRMSSKPIMPGWRCRRSCSATALAWSLRSVPADAADPGAGCDRSTGHGAQQPVAGRRRSQERGLPDVSHDRLRVDAQGWRAGRLHRLPRRRCHGVARADDAPRARRSSSRSSGARTSAPRTRHLEDVGQSGERVVSARSTSARHSSASSIPAICASPDQTCGACHAEEVRNVSKSMMTHGGMLWGAALYNNGSYPIKDTQFGEIYTVGRPAGDREHGAAADAADDRAAGHAAVSGAAVPVRGHAARQHPAHLRARRPAPARDRHSRAGRRARAARATA